MSPEKRTDAIQERITIDDIRHRAENVKSKAITEAKETVDEVIGENGARTLVIVAGLVLIAASLAYFLGTRSGRVGLAEELLGE
jgi:hypothetical protein